VRVSLVTIGEPLPILDGVRDRPLRAGYLAHALADRGHDVTWWTSVFDHARKRRIPTEHDSIEVRSGLRIRLMDGGGYHSNVSYARLRDHRRLAAAFSRLIRREARPDVILSSLPPVELSHAAVEYGEEASVPVVLDMRDMWPDIFADELPSALRGLGRMFLRPFFRQAREACRRATAITGVSEAMLDWGLRRGGRTRSALDCAFPPGYAVREPSPERQIEAEAFWRTWKIPADPAERIVCFFGNMGRVLDLDHVIECARMLRTRRVPLRFVLCGTGERLERYRHLAADVPNVALPGWVDEAKIQALLKVSYAGINPLPDRYDFLAIINNKSIEYLSAGVPVISSPTTGALARMLADLDCGATYDARNPGALAQVIEFACANPESWSIKSTNAKAAFIQHFTAEKVYDRFGHHLETIAASA
jgi:glycosyltransferase involved in cell wall biosynthesis